MGLFQEKEGDVAIIVENGVYKQVSVYTRDGYFYAKVSGGFIRLNMDSSTSKPNSRLVHLDTTSSVFRDTLGRLCLNGVSGSRLLEGNQKQILLGTGD